MKATRRKYYRGSNSAGRRKFRRQFGFTPISNISTKTVTVEEEKEEDKKEEQKKTVKTHRDFKFNILLKPWYHIFLRRH